jgi:hypothetical protein
MLRPLITNGIRPILRALPEKPAIGAVFTFFVTNPLTPHGQYGLMRPVARIAQSVEQGIENPRVLGSIPSPGTII